MKESSLFKLPTFLKKATKALLTVSLSLLSWHSFGQTADFTADQTVICDGSSVTFSDASIGFSGSETYSWDFGTGASPATATGIGPHTVTYSGAGTATVSLSITDVSTYTETKTDYITISSFPSAPAASVTQPTCETATGTIEVTSPLGASYEYSIDGVTWGINTTFPGLPENTTYTIRVRDIDVNSECVSSSDFTLDPQPPTPSAPTIGSSTQPNCDVATGSVILNGLPSSGIWTINESPDGATSSGNGTSTTISGLSSGTHTFTVTNEEGCTSASSTEVTINSQPPTPAAPNVESIIHPTCDVATGSVNLNGLPSSGTWILTQNPGGTTTNGNTTSTTVSGLTSGTYTFTVTNEDNCTSDPSADVIINTQPSTPPAPVEIIDCSLGAGQAVITVDSPMGTGYEYSLDGGPFQIDNTFSNVANGTHSITVLNADGCTTTGTSFDVSCGCLDPPTVTLSSSSGSTCSTDAITIDGNTFGGSATSVTIAADGAGTVSPESTSTSPFSFTYTPAAGDEGNIVTITVTTDNPSGPPCEAASATYSLSVSVVPGAPTVSSFTQPTCDVATGSANLTGLPSGSWTLTESPGGATIDGSGESTSISGLTEGTYSYTVTNADGCISGSSTDIVINAQPPTPPAPTQDVDCSLGFDQAVVNVTNPLGGQYQYSLDGGPYQSETSFSNVVNGNHTITVRNTDGCTTTGSSFSIDCGCVDAPTVTLTSTSGSACGTNQISISGNTFGGSATTVFITEDGSGTVSPTSASASPFSFTYTPDVNDAGNTVTITVITNNPLGSPCEADTATYTLTVNPVPAVPVITSVTQPTCNIATGSVTLDGLPSGNWTLTRSPDAVTTTGNSTSTTITGLAPGTYSYTVTGENGCTSASSSGFTINTQPPTPSSPTHNVDCSLGFGQAVVTVEGPLGEEYEYSLDGGAYQSSTTFSNVTNDTHAITVRNTDGCTATGSSFTVDCGCVDEPTLTLSGISGSTCATSSITIGSNTFGGSATSVTITENGAGAVTPTSISTSPFSFIYTPAAGDEGNIVTITVTTDNPQGSPCTEAIETYSLTVNPSPSAPLIESITQPTCAEATGSVNLSGLPSSGSWILTRNPGGITTNGNGETTTVTGLASGTYTFTVTNSQGCTSLSSLDAVIIEQPVTPPAPTQSIDCSLGFGQAVITVESPLGSEYAYSLDGGAYQSSNIFENVANGTHSITVRNTDGCTATGSSFDINCGCVDSPTVTLSALSGSTCGTSSITIDNNTFGGSATEVTFAHSGDGSVTPLSTGTSPFSFTYTPALTDAGNIVTITVTTDNPLGSPCEESTATFTLDVNPVPATPVIGSVTDPSCTVPTGSVVLNGLPSSGNWVITQTPGSVTTSGSGTSTTISGLAPGTYTFTVTDVEGCTSGSTADVTINSQPPSPPAPSQTVDCSLGFGQAVVTVTGPLGTDYEYSIDGGTFQSSTTFENIDNGDHYITVRNIDGCTTTGSSFNIDCGCVDGPSLSLSSASGSTCGTTPITVSDNVFGGNATSVTITHDGNGVVSPTTTTNSVFAFSYTPAESDQGNIVVITVTTDNPLGPPCVEASETYELTVFDTPDVPNIGSITHPTCDLSTGGVVISGLPSSGIWTLTRTPGGVTTSGTGTSTTLSGIPEGSYTYTVTNENGCISGASSPVVIDPPPPIPESPLHSVDCSLGFGEAVVNVTSPTGTGYQYSLDGGTFQTSTTFSNVDNGDHNITVINSSGCSTTGSTFTIDCGCVNGPTLSLSSTSGSTCGTTAITVDNNTFGGNATSVSITADGGGTVTPSSTTNSPFSFTYTPASADAGKTVTISLATDNPLGPPCESATATYSLTVNAPPTIPVTGNITQPGCDVATGSVEISGLPSSGTWTLVRNPGNVSTSGTGTSTTVSGLSAGTYTFEVINSLFCKSGVSDEVVINSQPPSPSAPSHDIDCSLGFNNAIVTVTGPIGTGYEYSLDGGVFQESTSFENVSNGSHNITVRNSSGCTTTGNNFEISCDCVNGPTLSLNSSSGSTCGTSTITVDNNTFGGSATSVEIGHNGAGEVIPISTDVTPFSFAYTPASIDAGSNVTITVITDNPLGTPCESATATYTLTVNAVPPIPSIGTVTQPNCSVATGSIELNGLPPSGNWTIIRNPGGITSNGSGTSTTITGLSPESYNFRVTNSSGCTSDYTSNVVIDDQPPTPSVPSIGSITHPTCDISTGSVVLNGLPSSGTWTLTTNPGGITSTGSGTSTTVSGLAPETYNFSVTNSFGCSSGSSSNAVINSQPPTPTAPVIGNITQPSCNVSTGSVVLNGLPSSGTWAITRQPGGVTTTGSGTSTTISGLSPDIYSFTVTNSQGCESQASANVFIDSQPETPSAPSPGTIIQPGCDVPTGSVVLNDLPSSGTWTINPGNISGTGTSRTISGLDPGNYNFTVTNAEGCTSPSSSTVTIDPQPVTPAVPTVGNITHPTCDVSTGRVFLSGLPSNGTWVITRSPGGTTTTGTGSSTTVTGIPEGSYNFAVRNADGCTSGFTSDVTIDPQPPTPPVPTQDIDCSLGFDFAVVTVTSPVGPNYEYSLDFGGFQQGTSFTSVANGSHSITVMNEFGCTTTSPSFSVSCGCVNGPTLTLSSISGSTCGTNPVTIENNSFGGSASSVSIRSDGAGTVIPELTDGSPFDFTYEPAPEDAGKTVRITVTTDNPLGSPCAAASETYVLRVYTTPQPPVPSGINQPTCQTLTGSVELNGLPQEGSWTLYLNPGNSETTGSGELTFVSNLASGTYNFRVSDQNGCISEPSEDIEILPPPENPDPPVAENIIPPTCTRSTGSVELGGLPSNGNWILTRTQGGVTRTGSGTNFTISNLVEGIYNYRVTNAEGCTSASSEDIVIPAQPEIPPAPDASTIVQPSCQTPTGSVILSGLPEEGMWTLTRFPGMTTITGMGAETTISGLLPGIYNYLVTNEAGCVSQPSANIIINFSPDVPEAPVVAQVIQPGCTNPEGSITLTGLPSGSWTLVQYPDEITINGSGVSYTLENLEVGSYSFAVTNEPGCTSEESQVVTVLPSTSSPEITITDPAPVCEPEAVDLTDSLITAGSDPGLTYSYWIDQDRTMSVETPDSVGAGTYYIRGATDEGCFDMVPVTVSVIEPPFAEAGPDQELDYQFETQMEATPPIPGDTGTWSVMSGNGIFEDSLDATTMVYELEVGANRFTWTVSNDICPPVQDSVTISVVDLVVPTLITPNNDGNNDYLVFEGIENLGRTELTVFDRYGKEVYSNDNYNNDWNGVDDDGNPLPGDTYFYVFTSENGRAKSSFVVLRR